jgi:streptomycin 6-kinase
VPIEVPLAFAATTSEREGEVGGAWLAALPDLVKQLLDRWDCTLDGDVTHGAVGLVIPVTRGNTAAVMKISFPHPGNVGEWSALAAFEGRGAVKLYDVEPDWFAMLLERAHAEDLSALEQTDEALSIAGRLARRLAVPATPETPRLCDLVRTWGSDLLDRHEGAVRGDRLPDWVVDTAARTFQELPCDGTETLIHGDLHFSNVLRGDREPWLAIDPKGLAGTPCFDAATVVRYRLLDLVCTGRPSDSLTHRVEVFSDAAAVDLDLALRCTQARFVSSYYWELGQHSTHRIVAAMKAASIAATVCLN